MKYSYGGQALIEGVMMCGKKTMAIAIRKPDGTISCKTEEMTSLKDKYPILGWPLIRGCYGLGHSLTMGFKALTYSANESAEDEEEELRPIDVVISVALALVLGVGLFFALPVVLAHLMNSVVSSSFMQNLLEGVIRVGIFLLYVVGVTKMKEIHRVFQFHGAEHKTIHAYENDEVLIPENCKKYTTLHPRCGTSFLFIVMIISIVLFSFLGVENFWWRMTSRILLLPVVAGVSYEFLKFSAKHMDNKLVHALAMPGIMLQKLTTKEPDDEMLEVAIVALQKVREIEEGVTFEPLTSKIVAPGMSFRTAEYAEEKEDRQERITEEAEEKVLGEAEEKTEHKGDAFVDPSWIACIKDED